MKRDELKYAIIADDAGKVWYASNLKEAKRIAREKQGKYGRMTVENTWFRGIVYELGQEA